MTMYGAQAGTALLTYIFSFHAHGRARQVVAMQISYDVIATLFFVSIFYLELLTGTPLVMAASRGLSSEIGSQAVFLALIFQFGAAILLVVIRKPVIKRVQLLFPPSTAEVLSQPRFLRKNASDSPSTALLLIEKEQFHLLERLPQYIEFVRQDTSDLVNPIAYHEAFQEISSRIGATLSRISGHSLGSEASDQLILTTKLEEQLASLEDIIFRLSNRLTEESPDDRARELGRNIMESVDFMVLTAIEAIRSRDDGEIEMLEMLTQDRSDMMTKIRHKYFESESELTSGGRNFVLDITIMLENAVYTLGRYARLLKTD